ARRLRIEMIGPRDRARRATGFPLYRRELPVVPLIVTVLKIGLENTALLRRGRARQHPKVQSANQVRKRTLLQTQLGDRAVVGNARDPAMSNDAVRERRGLQGIGRIIPHGERVLAGLAPA